MLRPAWERMGSVSDFSGVDFVISLKSGRIVKRREGSSAPPLTEEIMGPVRAQVAKQWPGVPIAPMMVAGATDGRFLMNAGVPTYGMSGMFGKSGEFNAHGLNEKIRVQSLYEGRDFLEGVVRAYVK